MKRQSPRLVEQQRGEEKDFQRVDDFFLQIPKTGNNVQSSNINIGQNEIIIRSLNEKNDEKLTNNLNKFQTSHLNKSEHYMECLQNNFSSEGGSSRSTTTAAKGSGRFFEDNINIIEGGGEGGEGGGGGGEGGRDDHDSNIISNNYYIEQNAYDLQSTVLTPKHNESGVSVSINKQPCHISSSQEEFYIGNTPPNKCLISSNNNPNNNPNNPNNNNLSSSSSSSSMSRLFQQQQYISPAAPPLGRTTTSNVYTMVNNQIFSPFPGTTISNNINNNNNNIKILSDNSTISTTGYNSWQQEKVDSLIEGEEFVKSKEIMRPILPVYYPPIAAKSSFPTKNLKIITQSNQIISPQTRRKINDDIISKHAYRDILNKLLSKEYAQKQVNAETALRGDNGNWTDMCHNQLVWWRYPSKKLNRFSPGRIISLQEEGINASESWVADILTRFRDSCDCYILQSLDDFKYEVIRCKRGWQTGLLATLDTLKKGSIRHLEECGDNNNLFPTNDTAYDNEYDDDMNNLSSSFSQPDNYITNNNIINNNIINNNIINNNSTPCTTPPCTTPPYLDCNINNNFPVQQTTVQTTVQPTVVPTGNFDNNELNTEITQQQQTSSINNFKQKKPKTLFSVLTREILLPYPLPNAELQGQLLRKCAKESYKSWRAVLRADKLLEISQHTRYLNMPETASNNLINQFIKIGLRENPIAPTENDLRYFMSMSAATIIERNTTLPFSQRDIPYQNTNTPQNHTHTMMVDGCNTDINKTLYNHEYLQNTSMPNLNSFNEHILHSNHSSNDPNDHNSTSLRSISLDNNKLAIDKTNNGKFRCLADNYGPTPVTRQKITPSLRITQQLTPDNSIYLPRLVTELLVNRTYVQWLLRYCPKDLLRSHSSIPLPPPADLPTEDLKKLCENVGGRTEGVYWFIAYNLIIHIFGASVVILTRPEKKSTETNNTKKLKKKMGRPVDYKNATKKEGLILLLAVGAIHRPTTSYAGPGRGPSVLETAWWETDTKEVALTFNKINVTLGFRGISQKPQLPGTYCAYNTISAQPLNSVPKTTIQVLANHLGMAGLQNLTALRLVCFGVITEARKQIEQLINEAFDYSKNQTSQKNFTENFNHRSEADRIKRWSELINQLRIAAIRLKFYMHNT